jgi:hypothetical protein
MNLTSYVVGEEATTISVTIAGVDRCSRRESTLFVTSAAPVAWGTRNGRRRSDDGGEDE